MPTYRVTIAGQSYEVQVPDPTERPVRAIVNGQVFEVQVTSEAVGQPATATPVRQTPPTPAAPRTSQSISITSASPKTSAPATATSGAGEDGQVFAPLPGTIVSISVSEGESVAHGQELCILEAMKMNNPIRATQPGVVREIRVSVGEQVQHGVPLMVIEASETGTGA